MRTDPDIELLVVDGRRGDDSGACARAAGACAPSAATGRVWQRKAGWRAPRGGTVRFLHAETSGRHAFAFTARRLGLGRARAAAGVRR